MPPVGAAGDRAEHEEQLVRARAAQIGNVWLVQTAVPPVETRLDVVTIGPVIESWRISIAASGEPAVRPAAASATRNVIVSMFEQVERPVQLDPVARREAAAVRAGAGRRRCWSPCSCPTG